jgi:D-ribose pyranase
VVKRGGILHPALSQLLASSGHGDYLTIYDRGFPVPAQPERIDLALVDHIPTVLDVLRAVIAEFHVDRVLIAEGMTQISRQRVDALRILVDHTPWR